MFDTNTRSFADVLESTPIEMFADPEQNNAAFRINQVTAHLMRENKTVDDLSLVKKIHFLSDVVIVGDGLIEKLMTDEDIRTHIVSIGGAELLGRSIVVCKAELIEARAALVELKKQL